MSKEDNLKKSLERLRNEIRKESKDLENHFTERISTLEKGFNRLDKTIHKLEEIGTNKQKQFGSGYLFPFLFVILALIISFGGDITETYRQLNQSQTLCRNVTFYHWEVQVPFTEFTKNCTLTKVQLIQFANKAFPYGPPLVNLLSATGRDLPDLIDFSISTNSSEPVMLVTLAKDEKFIWPAENLNSTFNFTLGLPDHPHTVEIKVISKSPRLLELHNFLSSEECDHFYVKARELEKQESKVGADQNSSTKSLVRTSSHTWMGRESDGVSARWYTDDVINRVEDRIFELTKLNNSTTEPFQVVFYNKEQYYYGHHDYSTKDGSPHNPYYQGGGNRLVTVLLYLNDVEEGGETAFPFVGKNGEPINRHLDPISLYTASACSAGGRMVKPKKGGAVMFYSLRENGHMDGNVDPFSLHAGCSVLKGEKYVTNKWIRNKRVDGKLYDSTW